MQWLDLNFVMPPNLFIHWECWSGGAISKRIRKGLRLIWEVVIWVIWRARNGCIFNNEIYRWEELVDEVKVMSWRWLLGRFNIPVCMFYEWCWSPRDCMMRWCWVGCLWTYCWFLVDALPVSVLVSAGRCLALLPSSVTGAAAAWCWGPDAVMTADGVF